MSQEIGLEFGNSIRWQVAIFFQSISNRNCTTLDDGELTRRHRDRQALSETLVQSLSHVPDQGAIHGRQSQDLDEKEHSIKEVVGFPVALNQGVAISQYDRVL